MPGHPGQVPTRRARFSVTAVTEGGPAMRYKNPRSHVRTRGTLDCFPPCLCWLAATWHTGSASASQGGARSSRGGRCRILPSARMALRTVEGHRRTPDQPGRLGFKRARSGGRETVLGWARCGLLHCNTKMFFFRQISCNRWGQTLTLTSPRCALRNSSMVVRDWPMPPPMLSGIWSFRMA